MTDERYRFDADFFRDESGELQDRPTFGVSFVRIMPYDLYLHGSPRRLADVVHLTLGEDVRRIALNLAAKHAGVFVHVRYENVSDVFATGVCLERARDLLVPFGNALIVRPLEEMERTDDHFLVAPCSAGKALHREGITVDTPQAARDTALAMARKCDGVLVYCQWQGLRGAELYSTGACAPGEPLDKMPMERRQ